MGLLHRAYVALRSSCLTAAVFRQKKNDATGSGSTASSRLQEVTHELEDLHVETESIDIEAQLQHHKKLLQEQKDKESFLGMRAHKYRKALDDRAMLLREEERKLSKIEHRRKFGTPEVEEVVDDCDGHLERKESEDRDIEEMTEEEIKATRADLELRTKNWERDEDALQGIIAIHRQILIHCEEIRRNIRTLERKRDEVASMRGEVEAFLMDPRVEELYETPAVGVVDGTEGHDGAEAEAERFLGAV